MMRRMITAMMALGLAVVMAVSAQAQDAEIEATISNQLEAFKADDFEKAFTYASPNIQAIFGSPMRFGQMVTTGFPMVHRPADVRFLELSDIQGFQFQQVEIRDGQGVFYVLAYKMVQVEDAWRIDGVQILPSREYGA